MDTTPFNIKELVSELDRLFSDEPRVLAVYLLGSACHGTMRPDSDIDLAILSDPPSPLSAIEKQHIATTLSYKMGHIVDIGDVSAKNLVYSYEALLNGKCIWKGSPKAELIAATLMGMYILFNNERKEVLNAYRTR